MAADKAWKNLTFLGYLFIFLFCHVYSATPDLSKAFSSKHTNNWAVIVCTSRFWFNYRHVANSLAIYRSVKQLGIPDSHIILMLADDMACNARNPRPGTVFSNSNQQTNVYGDDVEVDYRGYEVTVENFIRVITGRLPASVPRSKRLLSDDRSNILVYMTGHGGDGFLKFQDSEEISNIELADAFEQMWQKERYHEIFFMVDTCQAGSMHQQFYSPNILAVGSSKVGEDSLSHHSDPEIGVYVVDRYTYYVLQFLEQVEPNSRATIGQLFQYCTPRLVQSTPSTRIDLFPREIQEVLVTDFFGSVRNIELSNSTKLVIHAENSHFGNQDALQKQRSLRSLDSFPLTPKVVSEHFTLRFSLTFYCLLILLLGTCVGTLGRSVGLL
ncbi:GPI-anchor transamidase-like [Dendronephthya gigantea]|uniref:GPI-anchor transamidase-like n=1 Tax=Dendronephthya gigantea TaxID=151771 RepID=UPI00106C6A68|nr:GPI-anchor transamidase-like [Dendronephthya gigantea]